MTRILSLLMVFAALGGAAWAQPAKPAEPEPALDLDALFEQGKALFEEYAPDEIQRDYRFPSREEFNRFAERLQHALEESNLEALAAYAPEARAALAALQVLPGYEIYTDWLTERLDYVDAAAVAIRQPTPSPLPKTPKPTLPKQPKSAPVIPHYDLWLDRMESRVVPPRAAALLPRLRPVFSAEGLAPALVWMAEAESSFNPDAVSPVGAKGLFQLMPATARELGLSTFLPDERGDPEKNAGAAARYLKFLHSRFGDWPLAIAAYNAGPGRVQRTLSARQAKTFADISPALPSETRMYVPKVLAILTVRAGVGVEDLPAPGR